MKWEEESEFFMGVDNTSTKNIGLFIIVHFDGDDNETEKVQLGTTKLKVNGPVEMVIDTLDVVPDTIDSCAANFFIRFLTLFVENITKAVSGLGKFPTNSTRKKCPIDKESKR